MASELQHGTSTGYQRGCRCQACKDAHADRARNYYSRIRAEKKRLEREALVAEIIREYQESQKEVAAQ
jgi:hypothetical protein